ncbi:MAG: DUF6531 domain-containing protein [Methanosarcina sp.]
MLARSTEGAAAEGPKIGISEARALSSFESPEAEPQQPFEFSEAEPGSSTEESVETGPTAEAPLELQREPALETSQAIAERQESQLAYAEITPTEEASLLEESFASQLQEISADPSRLLEAAELDQILSPTEALASVEGEPVLIDSSVPLRASDSEGKLSKVDLALEETQQGYSPANPLVDIQLPRSSAGEIGIGDEGLALRLQGASPETEASQTDRGGVFLPEAAEDTSLLLEPVSAGVELSAMLTSRESPEQLAFSVSLPEGDQLHASSDGGAEVVKPSGEVAYRLFAPQAIDAQGTALPVAMAVQGNTLVISLKHREMDVAYPILIDPEFIEEGWSNIIGSGKWTWEWSGVPSPETYIGSFSCVVANHEGCNWGTGLYVRSRSNTTYPEHSYGRWKLNAPNSTSYFRYASMGPAHLNARGCTANEPHGYFGIWLGGSSWSILGKAYPSNVATEISVPPGASPLSSAGHTAFVGLEAEHASNISCGRDYALTGATFYMSDPENPTVLALSGIPSGWIKGGMPFTITEPVSDNGLGVKSVKLNSDGSESPQYLGCSGSLADPCPASHNFEFSLDAGTFPEGQRTISASAKDVLEKSSNTQEATLKIDRTKPGLVLSGQLARATEEEGGLAAEEEDETPFDPLHLAVYNLTLEAADGSNESAATERSGVKRIEIFLDGSKTPLKTWTQPGEPSSCDSCALTATYALKLNELSADKHHTLRVLASDYAGNEPREREIGFEYVPATGEKAEYVMQRFPLFDTEAEPEEGVEATGPELAVNLMNGNLVFHQKDVEVPGAAADLEVERFYNSLLPEDQNTEWGDGWTLAQTPELELEEVKSGAPEEGTLVEESGGVESQVTLPTKAGEEEFNPALQATITKEADGGYALSDETGESAGTLEFAENGQTSELETGEFSGVEYKYEGGDLSEIAVEDPGSAGGDPEKAAESELLAEAPLYSGSFGTQGTGNGQFEYAEALTRDPEGNLWVGDLDTTKGTQRIQEFNPQGEYLRQITAPGGGAEGRLYVSGLATDSEGNLWLTDWSHARVEEFNSKGEYIRRFGAEGTGNGQLRLPEGIAIDAKGKVLVADQGNGRIVEFTKSGEFIENIASKGTAPGQLQGPNAITTGPDGTIWVTDFPANQVDAFSESGEFLRRFGSKGSGPGQFNQPGGIAVDGAGRVWVGDQVNNRVQEFTEVGDFIRKIGGPGIGEGQFQLCYTIGLAVDETGSIWITDYNNHRVQHLRVARVNESPLAADVQDDPSLEVNVSNGLVEDISGEEAGTVEYAHNGAELTAVSGQEGETSYEYDGAGHMTKVELPNGSWAEIEYEAAYARVKAVKVSIEGGAVKTTHFEYTDSPSRSTRVVPDGGQATVYDMAADGSFVRWQNAAKAPEIEDLAGTLVDPEHRETAKPIEPGAYALNIKAFSAEGIARIEVVANNNLQVSEKTCTEDFEKEGVECEHVSDSWVTETANWQPGILYLEVIVTDREGHNTSERFWVNMPYTPPPDPESEAPPTFSEVKTFREEFGLDLDLKRDEEAINERIWSLLRAWENPYTPVGEVARATNQSFGVPLRQVDAAELEYREWYGSHDLPLIHEWAEANYPGTFAGAYLDHAAGGLMRVGFTQEQPVRILEAEQVLQLWAPSARMAGFSSAPTTSLAQLESSASMIEGATEPGGSLAEQVTDFELDEPSNDIKLGAHEVSAAEVALQSLLGANPPVVVHQQSAAIEYLAGRNRAHGRILAGDEIISPKHGCTANFGAWEDRNEKSTGDPIRARFLLTVGHCAELEDVIERSPYPEFQHEDTWTKVGTVNRTAFEVHHWSTDAEAIRVRGSLAPNEIYLKGRHPRPVGAPSTAYRNQVLCFSGVTTDRTKCKEVIGRRTYSENGFKERMYALPFNAQPGDSGSPVWNRYTGAAVGLVSARDPHHPGITYVAPLLRIPRESLKVSPGALRALSLDESDPKLHLIISH